MSYILEALRKAEAERQLGSAPTVHTMTVEPASAARAGRARAPLWAAAVLLLGAGAFAIYSWRAAPTQALVPVPVPAVVQASPPVAAVTVVAPAIITPPAPAPAPAPARIVAKADTGTVSAPAPAAAQPAPVVAKPAKPETPAAAPPAEDSFPTQQSLPEAIQRELPQVVFGGYMYSKNPADRLLLIDKVLRREGDEVAPGLTLEKLLPKAAVMNYRGFRYRVPY